MYFINLHSNYKNKLLLMKQTYHGIMTRKGIKTLIM